MQVGDLVKYHDDGDTGIVLNIDATGMFFIHWSDSKEGWYLPSELEVICK